VGTLGEEVSTPVAVQLEVRAGGFERVGAESPISRYADLLL
jgi:hypothetical protein